MNRLLHPLAVVAMLGLPRPALAAPASDASAQAKRAVQEGQRAYEQGDFESALVSFERAYDLDPQPVYLYPWAQAARNAGRCDLSRELYQRFLDSGVTGDARAAAEQNMARCEPKPEPVPESSATVDASPSAEPPPAHDPAPPLRTRPGDATGFGLLATGSVATIAGVAVLAVSGVRRNEQQGTRDHTRFDDLDTSIDRLHLAGGLTLGVGVALLAAGAIRLGVVRRSSQRPVAATWSKTAQGTAVFGFRVGR